MDNLAYSLEYQLQKMEPGVVILDGAGRIRSANPLARRVLGGYQRELIGCSVVELHPEPSRRRIAWLLQEAAQGESAAPMTIAMPAHALMLKITRLEGAAGRAGFCLLFYDLGEMGEMAEMGAPGKMGRGAGRQPERHRGRHLAKIPVLQQGGTTLLDPAEVVRLQAEGHYARLFTARESFLCHLSLAELERRLDGERFLRVHRSHLIALAYAERLEREASRQWVVMATFPPSRIAIGRSRAAAVGERLGL